MTLAEYHALQKLPGGLYGKTGSRGLEPAYRWLAQAIEPHGDLALDLLGGLGQTGLKLQKAGMQMNWLETSRASVRCLQASFGQERVFTALPWDLARAHYDLISLVLPAERGNRFVEFCLQGAALALRPGGKLWLAGDRLRGFDRYHSWASAWLGPPEQVLRQGSLRLAVFSRTLEPPPLTSPWEKWTHDGQLWTGLPGIFSPGHPDAGSRELAAELPDLSGARVLDLGAGYGWLGKQALQRGAAQLLGLDDDWSSCLSAQANGLKVLHSDVDEALPVDTRFDIIISNPPFHLGGSVVMEVARAFLCAAQARLEKGGRFFLVANAFLPYEPLMTSLFGRFQRKDRGSYKVLVAERC